jgi:hypothetical protein
MKTLKESLLAGIETSMQAGDTYVKIPENALKELSKEISLLKNYDRLPKRLYPNGYSTKFLVAPEMFEFIGYEANHIEIMVYQPGVGAGLLYDDLDWRITIYISNRGEYGHILSSAFDVSIYLSESAVSSFKEILKTLIKPMTKDLNTFKHSLEMFQKYDGQLVEDVNWILK